MNKINFKEIEKNLINIQKPGRYIGNESGLPKKDFINSNVRFVICYPDTYEVGMSNQGIKIIYDRINKNDCASCERVFSPWVDFDFFLRKNNIPLFSLETKTPLKQFDFVGISLQHELLFSNFLNILELSQISVFSEKRENYDPIIICGGPSSVNPEPYSPFVDLFLIGEAEEVIDKLITLYNYLKSERSLKRIEIIKKLSKLEGIYSPLFPKDKVKRQVYKDFCNDLGVNTHIIPNIDTVQNKLVVEIMRGCPNKCRFCQAGVTYKPYREKNIDLILSEIDNGINSLGINEITLSSLSSGDYSQIIELTECFNTIFASRKISFSLPSIRVETFDTALLEKINSVRKSGLTFAIESGSREGQLSINKEVLIDKISYIISFAVRRGWKLIKLYFMIGLPGQENEVEDIKTFIDNILSLDRKLIINLNVAVFVPKPHTPFQSEKQLTLDESLRIFNELEYYYKRSRVKIKKHDPHASYVEGFIARGDKNVGLAVYDAFKNGARFDSWKEHFNYELYNNAFLKNNITYEKYLSGKKENNFWKYVDVGLSSDYFETELKKSQNKELTKSCKEECEKECDICKDGIRKNNSKIFDTKEIIKKYSYNLQKDNKPTKYLIEFSKKSLLKFVSHIDIIKYFERLFLISKVPIMYTEGFNPHPKLQFSHALQLGIESNCELLEFMTEVYYDENELLAILKKNENKMIPLNRIKHIKNEKKISYFDNITYYLYTLRFDKNDYPEIKLIFNGFNESNNFYDFEKKGKIINGKYQDYIKLLKLDVNIIELRANKKIDTPKITRTVEDLFKGIDIEIMLNRCIALQNNKEIDLFELQN